MKPAAETVLPCELPLPPVLPPPVLPPPLVLPRVAVTPPELADYAELCA